ncbi:MAG: glycosyl hydrolase [Cyclobacteriaceae bacterium]
MKHLLILIVISLQAISLGAQTLDSIFSSVKYRNIGPFRGGRSVTATGVIGDPLTYYMGTTGGGLWKTDDAGQRWSNISDGYFTTGSVGAVAVSASDPNVVYVGMGEHAPRAVMTSYGDGMYKSTDAGKTWKKIGLEKTRQISRIIIHPKNPDIVYVAAQGAINGPNPERGVYKSTDGGNSWAKLLYVNDLTGCSELSMDANNPNVMYAAMWEHQRLPWKVISGGAGSGLYKTSDAGKTWKKIHNDLPKEMGKMAIAVSRSNSEKVYALIESDTQKEQGGLFVSENGGENWSKVSSDHRLVQRAWYYIEVFVDPNDENTVYVLSAPALRSIDGGKTWERLTGTHGDYHDLWINPENSNNMVIANDGGAAISFNYAKTWSTQQNMPTSQFYRVNVDNNFPYRIYAGQQDNSSVRIQSTALGRRSITTQNWTYSAGGESAFLAFDPDNPRYVMGGSYLSSIEVLDMNALASTGIPTAPIQYLGRETRDMKYRFNWNSPIIWSKHEPGTYYHGAQLLLRTRDLGTTWDEVSPDLTRNEDEKQGKGGGPYTNEAVGAENYGTLTYIAESPHEKGVIWTGSDDGLVQLTRDGGENWTNVTPKGLPETLINSIELSPSDPATAYIATTRYKFNDLSPALYKTTNYGKSWTNITNGIPDGAYTRVVREDEKMSDLLYAGTETGIYISWNGGKNWEPFNLNFPVTPVTDMITRHGDLVVATAGRSFWVLDDLELLRQYKKGNSAVTLFKPEDAMLGNWGSPLNGNSTDGTDPFVGLNPANGLVIYYELPKLDEDAEITLEIRDSSGDLVRSLRSEKDKTFERYAGGPSPEPTIGKKKGINRFVWDLRYPMMIGAPKAYIEGSFRGHKASPGDYTMTLKAGDQSGSQAFKILPNPLYETSTETYAEYHTFMSALEENFSEMHRKVNAMMKMQNQIKEVIKDLPEDEDLISVRETGEKLVEKMKAWDEDMVQRKSKAYDDVENFLNKFTAEYIFLINSTESDIPKVNNPSKERRDELNAQWEKLNARAVEIMETDVPTYNKLLNDAGIGVVR